MRDISLLRNVWNNNANYGGFFVYSIELLTKEMCVFICEIIHRWHPWDKRIAVDSNISLWIEHSPENNQKRCITKMTVSSHMHIYIGATIWEFKREKNAFFLPLAQNAYWII